jgi:predicted ATPase
MSPKPSSSSPLARRSSGGGREQKRPSQTRTHFSSSGRGSWDGIWDYYIRPGSQADNINNRIDIQFHDAVDRSKKGNFYFRSAYRQEADFTLKNLTQIGDPTEEEKQIRKMMASDVSVSKNYQRLASQALLDAFAVADAKMTLAEFRENVIGELNRTILDLFPNLDLNTLGNPLEEGTFRFNKGQISGFKYKNLSGGEKAAFDLILDIVVKKKAYANSVYCIDEPELHMNTRLQGGLLDAILKVLPQESQLWISTHSIGMMRKAQELWRKNPLEVVFLDFGSIDPDTTSVLRPSRPTKSFWQNILSLRWMT